MMPEKFTIPYIDIDPELKHGGIPNGLENQFVFPDLGDNWKTTNIDLLRVFRVINDIGTSISMHPVSDIDGVPDKALTEEILDSMNSILENVVDVTHAANTKTHMWTHAIPPMNDFQVRGIRYPLRNSLANEFVHHIIGMLIEVAELNRNGYHSGIDPQSADRIIAPVYSVKAFIMKHYFDLEVAGELSREEMRQLTSTKFRPGPTVSYPDQSAEPVDDAELTEAMSGVDVIQWAPDQRAWVRFADLRDRRYRPERIRQPEGIRQTTEDVAPAQPLNAEGELAIRTTEGQP